MVQKVVEIRRFHMLFMKNWAWKLLKWNLLKWNVQQSGFFFQFHKFGIFLQLPVKIDKYKKLFSSNQKFNIEIDKAW